MSDATTSEPSKVNLRRIDPAELEIGLPLPGDIRAASGRTLIRKGRVLHTDDLDLIADKIVDGVYVGDDWPETIKSNHKPIAVAESAVETAHTPEPTPAPPSESIAQPDQKNLTSIALERLYVGKRLSYPIYAPNGVLLLAAGLEVTHRFMSRLRKHGIREILISTYAPEAQEQINPKAALGAAAELDALVERLSDPQTKLDAYRRPRQDLPLSDLRAEIEHGCEVYDKSLPQVAQIAQDVATGQLKNAGAARDVVSQFLNMVELDGSLVQAVIKLKNSSSEDEYLFQHGLNVAMVSMVVAWRLGLRREIVLQIGLGAMLQDVGMLQVPRELRLSPRQLTEDEREVIAQHPLHSLEFLQRLEGLGNLSLLICYQSHERADGTGYPRHRGRALIHPFAHLVAAVETFIAIGSDRPYRSARMPYQAMESLLRTVGTRQFTSDVVRHILDCMSLFPVNSYVRLSDGHIAKVVRANAGFHTKPVVVLLSPDGTESSVEVDLSKVRELHVVQALGSPDGT